MPRKSEMIKLEGTVHDRRVKLTNEDKIRIKELYETGEFSQRKLASMFEVSRRLITFCIDPEKLKQNIEARRVRGGTKIYYNKEYHTNAMREHRAYKQKLVESGKIKLETK